MFSFYLEKPVAEAYLSDHHLPALSDVIRFRQTSHYAAYLNTSSNPPTTQDLAVAVRRFEQARLHVAALEANRRASIAAGDPVAATLRAYTASQSANTDADYVDPTSIQSTQSPAAYLAYIYSLSDQIVPKTAAYALDARRPDLASFVLSVETLNEQVSTLQLANELLISQIVSSGNLVNENSLLKAFQTTRYPTALPYHKEHCIVRSCLENIHHLSLNGIAARTSPNLYPIDLEIYCPLGNPADRLKLYGGHTVMFSETPSTPRDMYDTLFGLERVEDPNGYLQHTTNYCTNLDLSFQELRQLVRDDVNVTDENGDVDLLTYARFFNLGWQVQLVKEDDGSYKTQGKAPGTTDFTALSPSVHELQNKCIRLYKRSNLSLFQLDWILMCATYTSPSYNIADEANHSKVLQSGAAVVVLAHCVDWMKKYDLSVDEFTALLADVNCYRRQGTDEKTLMYTLFGNDAAQVTAKTRRYGPVGKITVGEIETSGMGDILRRGFQLTKVEWNAVLTIVASAPTDPLNSLMMGRIYRLSKVFRMAGWSVLEGLLLLEKVSEGILSSLGTSNAYEEVLSVLGKVLWLADWMNECELSPLDVVTILTAPADGNVFVNQDAVNWVEELQRILSTNLVVETDFANFTEWEAVDGSKVTISAQEWVTELRRDQCIDDQGLVIPDSREAIRSTVKTILENKNVNVIRFEKEGDKLVNALVERMDMQHNSIDTQVSKKSNVLGQTELGSLYVWMGSNYYDMESVMYNWSPIDDKNSTALGRLFNLFRHIMIIERLNLNYSEVQLIVNHPTWIAAEMTTPVSLKQVYLLSRFKWLQNENTSANDWIVYFEKAALTPSDNSELVKQLKELVSWPEEDIKMIVNSTFEEGDGYTTTVEQSDYLFRCISVCRDAKISAAELLALQSCNGVLPQWSDAAAAAQSSIRRYFSGNDANPALGAIDEELRDALVGFYLRHIVPDNPDLNGVLNDSDDLYQYLLLDVNVSSEVPTTRLLENIGAVQLYINRALKNVEQATFDSRKAFRDTWKDAHEYRHWEATESLKLYPCNYVEPELRQDKTEIFYKLEQEISQADINEDTVSTAVYSYISSLQNLSELQINGFFYTRNVDVPSYYFTATASWEKHGYYYRSAIINRNALKETLKSAIRWGGWKKMTLGISQETVFGVYPAFAWGRLYMFWFEVEKVSTSNNSVVTDQYFLRPYYSRQNLDATFSGNRTPSLGRDVKLDITDLFVGSEAYAPFVYQPLYDASEDAIVLYFLKKDDSSEDTLIWTMSERKSKNVIETLSVGNSRPQQELPSYDVIANGISFVKNPLTINNPTLTASTQNAQEQNAQGTVYFVINNSEWKLQSGANKILVSWGCDSATVRISGRSSYTPMGLSVYLIVQMNGKEILKENVFSGTNYTIYPTATAVLLSDKEDVPAFFDLSVSSTGFIQCYIHVSEFPSNTSGSSSTLQTAYTFNEEQYRSYVFCGKEEEKRENESYLLIDDQTLGTVAVASFSSATTEITKTVLPGSDLAQLFTIDNQTGKEVGVDQFLKEVDDSKRYKPIIDPKPQLELDFYGPFGIYAWEMFYYIPSLITSIYSKAGKFQQALSSLEAVFDPCAEDGEQWNVVPLIEPVSTTPPNTWDPDVVARFKPFQYQIATTRQYLQILCDQGDSSYREETTESLRVAKMYYVSALDAFEDKAGERLSQSTRENWANPLLGSVTESDFRDPVNRNVEDFYRFVVERIDNIRNWRSIDGEPLSIPLIAPPIDPKVLQQAALSAAAMRPTAINDQDELPITFDEALAKAKAVVQNFMYLGDLLYRGLRNGDKHTALEMRTQLESYVVENYELGGQMSLIESMKKQICILEKEKEEAQCYKDWHKQFANERLNGFEIGGTVQVSLKNAMHLSLGACAAVYGGIKLMPTIFGMAVGGQDPAGPIEASLMLLEESAEICGSTADMLFLQGEFLRRQQENEMEKEATELAIRGIELSIDKLKYDLSQEEGTRDVLKGKLRRTKALADFVASRVTNAQFYQWYIGQVKMLYGSAYDITTRFCRLAERIYKTKVPGGESFLHPVWDATHFGLLSGQSLMLDLERMELAYMQYFTRELRSVKKVSMKQMFQTQMKALSQTGRTMFTLDESQFDDVSPLEFNRRIKSIRVTLCGIEDDDLNFIGHLRLLGHRVFSDRQKDRRSSKWSSFRRQETYLTRVDTDTAEVRSDGRLGVFEGCGVESTWILSFPAVVDAIDKKKTNSKQCDVIRAIDDVIMEIRYTART